MHSIYGLAAAAAVALAGSAAAAPADHSFTTSDGVKLHYVEEGKGPAVILIHGYTGDADGNWVKNGIFGELAKNHRVIAVDMRGHGKSDKPHDPAMYAGDRMPSDVLELMDSLKIRKAHIAGYSMGGGITGQLMARAPDRFLSASFGGSGVREADGAAQAAAAAQDKKCVDPKEAAASAHLRASPTRDSEALEAVQKGRTAKPSTAPPIDLRTISFPVQAVNGECDSPMAKTVRMKRELKRFDNVVLPGDSHLTAVGDPLYRESLVKFINAHDPKG
jgi:pimeloyl-ACP methyl ester carboxylesterase